LAGETDRSDRFLASGAGQIDVTLFPCYDVVLRLYLYADSKQRSFNAVYVIRIYQGVLLVSFIQRCILVIALNASLLCAATTSIAGTMVSNLAEYNNFGMGTFGLYEHASSFTTDSIPYHLNSITIAAYANADNTQGTLKLYWDLMGKPGALFAELGTKSIPAGEQMVTFSAIDTTLNSNTTFWVSVSSPGDDFAWTGTTSTSEVSAGSWTIGDQVFNRIFPNPTWAAVDLGSPYESGKFAVDATDARRAGDLNADGFVGQADLTKILEHWGQSVTPGSWPLGDPTGDGFVSQDDLNLVLGNWGLGTPAIETVPEPTTLLMMGIAGIGLLAMQRRQLRAK